MKFKAIILMSSILFQGQFEGIMSSDLYFRRKECIFNICIKMKCFGMYRLDNIIEIIFDIFWSFSTANIIIWDIQNLSFSPLVEFLI